MGQKSLRTDDCMENVIKVYSTMVYRLAFSQTRNKSDADDIYQEVFLRYIRKNRSLKQRNIKKPGLFELPSIAARKCGYRLG